MEMYYYERIKTFYCDVRNKHVTDYMWKERDLLDPFDTADTDTKILNIFIYF